MDDQTNSENIIGTDYMNIEKAYGESTGKKYPLDYNQMQSYTPNLGNCEYKGSWGDEKTIDDCDKCVTSYGFYGEQQYFCDGSCMSKYDTNKLCSIKGLVAKNEEQCRKPCYQRKPQSSQGSCQDNFDCMKNEECVKNKFVDRDGICLKKENFKFIGVI